MLGVAPTRRLSSPTSAVCAIVAPPATRRVVPRAAGEGAAACSCAAAERGMSRPATERQPATIFIQRGMKQVEGPAQPRVLPSIDACGRAGCYAQLRTLRPIRHSLGTGGDIGAPGEPRRQADVGSIPGHERGPALVT